MSLCNKNARKHSQPDLPSLNQKMLELFGFHVEMEIKGTVILFTLKNLVLFCEIF